MRRSELLRALGESLGAGSGATEVMVVVRIREAGEASSPKIGVFGDVDSPDVASAMLRNAWLWVEREGRVIDSSGVLVAMLRPAEGEPN